MGKRSYPPLTQSEMQAILKALGFKEDRTNKHPVWIRPADACRLRKVIPLDDYPEFEQKLIKRMIPQTGFSRDQFYAATKGTAKKINISTVFTPCYKCGNQLGGSDSCDICLAFRTATISN
jgi:hypothetical protein